MPSPVVELNRAVAVSMDSGAEDALTVVEALVELGPLDDYHLLHSVRGDLLERLGRREEAAASFERAAALARNRAERGLLERRVRALQGPGDSGRASKSPPGAGRPQRAGSP